MTWLPHRVAQAVEAGEEPADLLTNSRRNLTRTERDARNSETQPQPSSTSRTSRRFPKEEAAKTLAAIEAEPNMTRELLMRRIAEAWLAVQRRSFSPPTL